jgi:hypothetical protein
MSFGVSIGVAGGKGTGWVCEKAEVAASEKSSTASAEDFIGTP